MTTRDFTDQFETLPINNAFGNTITLYDYQKSLLDDFDTYKYLIVKHSRQMGITTLLTLKIANFLINNTDEHKTILFISNKLDLSYDMVKKVIALLSFYYIDIPFVIDNKRTIKLKNGNTFKIVSPTTDGLRGIQTNTLIIDNAADINNLNDLLGAFLPMCNKVILTSGNNINPNFFNKLFINDNDNVYVKRKVLWNLRPEFNSIRWYEDIKKMMGDDKLFDSEVNLIDCNDCITVKKDRTISIRLNEELITKVSMKLINDDISLSDYIRTLIINDLY